MIALLLLTACAPEAPLSSSPAEVTQARAARLEVCHVRADGSTAPLRLPPRAALAHQLHHGDWLITEEVPGDGVDNDCDGEVDESACTLYAAFGGLPAAGEFDGYAYGYAYAADDDPTLLYSYTDVYFYGWTSDGAELRFSVDAWDFGTWHEATWGDGWQETTWTWTDADGVTTSETTEGPITAEEYAACTDEAFEWAGADPALYAWDYRDGL